MNSEFWTYLQRLIEMHEIVIDRPKGSIHPLFYDQTYPVDYGYLKGTTSTDLSCVDVWVGSMCLLQVVGILCTVDLLKRDTELKLLYDCTEAEIQSIDDFVNREEMRSIVIKRERK